MKNKHYIIGGTLSALILLVAFNASNISLAYYKLKQSSSISFAQSVYAENQETISGIQKEIERYQDTVKTLLVSNNKMHICAEANRKLKGKDSYIDCETYEPEYGTPGKNGIAMSEDQIYYGWKTNSDNKSQEYVKLNGSSVFERARDLFKKAGRPSDEVNLYFKAGYETNIKPEVLICISKADSSLGNELLTKNNYGNVGNTDSGKRKAFDTKEEGIVAIGNVLNNKYLGSKKNNMKSISLMMMNCSILRHVKGYLEC